MLPDLQALAQKIREIARAEILPRFERVGYELKSDGSILTEADLAANQRIHDYLQQAYPSIHFLSEEMEEATQEGLLRTADLLWCLDPLDGTSNFAAGVPLFATALALFQQGEVVLSLTYDPVRDEMFTAAKGQGAWLNGQRLHCHASGFALDKAVALVDFKRLPKALKQALLDEMPFGSQRNLGTCALEWAWMAANRGHVYVHGGMKLWDLAAGSLLLAEAGGHACTLEGEAVCRPALGLRSAVASPDKALFDAWYGFLHAYVR